MYLQIFTTLSITGCTNIGFLSSFSLEEPPQLTYGQKMKKSKDKEFVK